MTEVESLRLGFAFGLGAATFFAPCAIPLLPGYVAYFVGTDGTTEGPTLGIYRRLGRAVGISLITSFGFLVVYGALAAVVFAIGTQILGNIAVLELIVGAILVVVGIGMLSGRRFSAPVHIQLPERRRGPLGYFAFGVIYALAAAGCTAALFFGVAGIAVAAGPVAGVAVVGAYAAGMGTLLIVVTILTALGRDLVVRRIASSGERIRRMAGAVLILAGVVQLYFFLFEFQGLRMLGF